jgi:hypothetical protein
MKAPREEDACSLTPSFFQGRKEANKQSTGLNIKGSEEEEEVSEGRGGLSGVKKGLKEPPPPPPEKLREARRDERRRRGF